MKTLTLIGILGAVVFIGLMVMHPDTMLSPGKLVQGHQEISQQCFSCHQAFGGIENNKCIACHELSAIGKDTQTAVTPDNKVLFHQKLDKLDCTTCHTDHAGLIPENGLKGFEHAMLPKTVINECMTCHQKPEDKLHRQLTNDCAKCHSTTGWELESAFNHDMVQVAERNNCVSCHQKPVDKLHRQLTDACVQCHNTTGWKMETAFNHDMVQLPERNNCIACHENPADAFHKTLKDNCTKCHSTEKWIPSTFDHAAYFVLDSDHNAKCATCHLNNNYTTYTCYGCHEHTVNNILQEHREEGITNLNNCVRCHKSSNENEGGENRGKNGGDEDDD